MTITYMDSFDFYGNSTAVSKNWNVGALTIGSTPGRYDGNAVTYSYPASEQYLSKAITSVNSLAVGFAIKSTAANMANKMIVKFQKSASDVFLLTVGYSLIGDYYFVSADNKSGEIARTGPLKHRFEDGVWNYFEIEFFSDPTSGIAAVYLNSELLFEVVNVNTTNATNQLGVDNIRFRAWGFTDVIKMCIDDFYVTNTNQRLGECHIATLLPDGDIQKQWGRSSGSNNYSLINSGSFSNVSNYVVSPTPGRTDIYSVQNPASKTNKVGRYRAICYKTYAYNQFAFSASLAISLKTGTTTMELPAVALGTGLGAAAIVQTTPIELNFETSNEWTLTDLNNLQIGIRSTT